MSKGQFAQHDVSQSQLLIVELLIVHYVTECAAHVAVIAVELSARVDQAFHLHDMHLTFAVHFMADEIYARVVAELLASWVLGFGDVRIVKLCEH